MDNRRRRQNQQRGILMTLIILFLILCGIFVYSKGYLEVIKKENKIVSIEALEERINKELKKGNSEFVAYLKDIDKEELKNINDLLDGFYGYINSYTQIKEVRNKWIKTSFSLEISDNYYAYHSIKDKMEIPADRKTASKLASTAAAVLNEIITDGMTDYEKEKAIHDYVVKTVEYGVADQKNNTNAYHAYGALIQKKGVCNAYAEAVQLLLILSDIESKIVIGEADGISHAWNLVQLDKEWYHVDATWNDPVPDEEGRVIYSYFNITDDMIKTTHQWNVNNYPDAKSMAYNPFVMNKTYIQNYEEFKSTITKLIKDKPKQIVLMIPDYNETVYKTSFILNQPGVLKIEYRTYGESPCTTLMIDIDYK